MEKHVMQYQTVHFNLNGKDVERTVDVRASLTDMLRNDFRMTSVKKGCEVGECGACNVLIDGEAYNSCIYLAVWAEGKHIRTREIFKSNPAAHSGRVAFWGMRGRTVFFSRELCYTGTR